MAKGRSEKKEEEKGRSTGTNPRPDLLKIVGANGKGLFDPSIDICFGKMYSGRQEKCKTCLAPVLVDGRIQVFSSLCQAKMSAGRVRRITKQEAREMLERGETVIDIFKEVLGAADFDVNYKSIRRHLRSHLRELEKIGVPVPTLPKKQDLREAL